MNEIAEIYGMKRAMGDSRLHRDTNIVQSPHPRRIDIRGAAGAVAFHGPNTLRVAPPVGGGPVVDTVGAGDAFASVLIAGRLRNWPLEVTLPRAQALAGAVVGLRGATTTDAAFYRRVREEWEQT